LSVLGLGALLFGCAEQDGSPSLESRAARKDVEILSLTEILGSVNGQDVKASISAVIDTGRGGRSTCTFTALPERFNPGTFSTHT
jgi:hypothetical protein